MPDYRQLDFEPLPPPVAGLVPNGTGTAEPTDQLLEGEDAAAQAALKVQVSLAAARQLQCACVMYEARRERLPAEWHGRGRNYGVSCPS